MDAWRSLQTRISEQDELRVDIATTILFELAWLIEVTLVSDHSAHANLVSGVLGAVAIAPMFLRRRMPIVPPLALSAVCILSEAFPASWVINSGSVPIVAFFLEMYSLGRHVEGRRLTAAAGVSIAGLFLALTLDTAPHPEDILWVGFLFGAPLLAGRALRNRTKLNQELREKAEREEGQREQRAAEAIERERSRIATELQAVVANGVSAMVVQAGAVPRLLDAGDGERANAALAEIEETGRDALIEMRRLLGVLRRADDDAELAPQPSLMRAEELVRRYGTDGFAVDLVIEGERRRLASGVDLAGFRVLEQSLAAARDAEAGSARVVIRYAADDVELEVSDDRAYSAAVDRTELAALRDRLSIYGGHLSTAGGDGAGFDLRARLPVEAS